MKYANMKIVDFKNWLNAIIYPKSTFGSLIEKEKASLVEAVKNVAVSGLIMGVIVGIIYAFLGIAMIGANGGSSTTGAIGGSILLFFALLMVVILPVIYILDLFICSAAYFVIAKILGGKGDFKTQTYFISLILAPLLILSLFGIIPLIGFIFLILISVYSIYLMIIAIRETHEFSTLRAAITYFIPGFLILLLIVPIVLWQLGIFGGSVEQVNTARGFYRIKVFDNSIKYSGDTLSFTLMNGAGSSISDLKIVPNGSGCGIVEGTPAMLAAGDTTTLNVNCFSLNKGESFSVAIKIEYSETVIETKITRTEQGTIRGTAE